MRLALPRLRGRHGAGRALDAASSPLKSRRLCGQPSSRGRGCIRALGGRLPRHYTEGRLCLTTLRRLGSPRREAFVTAPKEASRAYLVCAFRSGGWLPIEGLHSVSSNSGASLHLTSGRASGSRFLAGDASPERRETGLACPENYPDG